MWIVTVAAARYGTIVGKMEGPLGNAGHFTKRRRMSGTLLEGSHPFARSSFPYPSYENEDVRMGKISSLNFVVFEISAKVRILLDT